MMIRFIIILLFVTNFLSGCASAISSQSSEVDKMFIDGLNALHNKDYHLSMQIADQCINIHEQAAKQLNGGCADMMKNRDIIAKCRPLNLTVQCLYIKLEAYHGLNDYTGMSQVCDTASTFYYNGYVFDPQGWPWKFVEGCREILKKWKVAQAAGTEPN